MTQPFEPDVHRRRSIRLKGYDYASPGAYFITICVRRRECLFGEIVDDQVHLNSAGRMIQRWWGELENKFPFVKVDECVVMPNHFHGIIMIVGADLRVCPEGAHAGAPLPQIVQWFKTMTTNDYIRGVKQRGWPRFSGGLWQRNYYERVIRDDDELNRARRYIVENPLKWALDSENPAFHENR